MASLKQIAANRANAKASTGPKTQEGKAASSQNSTRHGLRASTICLEAEDKPRFEALVASFTAQFEPRNAAEAAVVESLAIAHTVILRTFLFVYSGTVPDLKKLLIVDDDPSIHELIRAMLAEDGWQIDGVHNGEEALNKLKAQSYDLVLTDILMPGMDGLTLLSRLRSQQPNAHVVVMTVKNTPDHIVGSLRNDAAGYVSKPFTRDILKETLHNALSTKFDHDDIKILSDKPYWVSLQVRCKLSTADRLTQFIRELPSDLDPEEREPIATAFRELLMNAIEHGGKLDPKKTVDLSYIRTARCIVYYLRDPGEGFQMDKLQHAAIANSPDQPYRHLEMREQMGIRPGGFGLLMTKNFADELIYSGKGNEVILIKYL
jgi:DNA-binding response OmpR family regulator